MTADAESPPRTLQHSVDDDRRETDESLRHERRKTDELIQQDSLVDESGERLEAEQRLQHVRKEVDSHLDKQADVLPKLSAKLENVAHSLTEAAASLTGVAATLTDAVAEADDGAAHPGLSRGSSDVSRNLGQLAEIAGGMAEITADLDAERQAADEKLRRERQITNHIIEEQVEQTETVAAEEREERALLAQERQATDEDLAQERQHTDDAVGHVVDLLVHEREAHAVVQRDFSSRNEFLAIVSHDLRGPLATASVAATLIADVAPKSVEGLRIRSLADRIQRSVAIMDRLIRDLLDFASFEDGRLQVAARPQDVRSLITQTLDIFQPLAAAKSQSLDADLPEGPVVAAYDHHRMLQVVSNVLQNAIKFTPEGGSVRVRVAPGGGECVIAVTDTGIGIPKEELESVFERFKQLSGERGGLGLGLYISKWIVEAHGGRIWADSLPGAGTTFYFTLPQPS